MLDSECKLVRVIGTVNNKGYKTTVREYDVVEKSKCYDTIGDRPRKRFRKTILGKLESNIVNTINARTGLLSFNIVCLPKDIESSKKTILNALCDKVEDYKDNVTELYDHLLDELHTP